MKLISVKSLNQALLSVLLFIFVALVGTTAHAVNNYYVSPSGSGSACTQAAPCSSINQAHSSLSVGSSGNCVAGSGWITVPNAGACVHVLPGNYSGTINTSKSGGSSTKIVYISETKWGAHLLSPQITLNGNYSALFGFDINGPNVTFAVLMQAGNNREVQYNYIHDIHTTAGCTNPRNGVIHETTAPSNHDVFNGNILHHFGNASCGTNGFHGIYADGAAATITNNVISGGAEGWGIQKQYAGNTDCTPGTISNNTVFNNAGGIVINDEGSSCGFHNWTMNNNIIVNNGISGTGGGGAFGIDYWSFTGNGTTLVSNNMVYGNLPANYANHGNACTAGTANCPSTNPKTDASTAVTFVNFQSDTNASPASNYNPENYQLKAGSNAIQNGTTNCATSGMSPCVASLDIVGVVRLASGTVPDLGAYEQQGSVASVPSAPTGLTAVVQ